MNQGQLGPESARPYSNSARVNLAFFSIYFMFWFVYSLFIIGTWTYLQTWKDVFLNYNCIFGNERVFNDLVNKNLLQSILGTLKKTLHVNNCITCCFMSIG
jgi:hypothetical protein